MDLAAAEVDRPLILEDRDGHARHRLDGHLEGDSADPDRPSRFRGLSDSPVDQPDRPSGDPDSGGLGMSSYLVLGRLHVRRI